MLSSFIYQRSLKPTKGSGRDSLKFHIPSNDLTSRDSDSRGYKIPAVLTHDTKAKMLRTKFAHHIMVLLCLDSVNKIKTAMYYYGMNMYLKSTYEKY